MPGPTPKLGRPARAWDNGPTLIGEISQSPVYWVVLGLLGGALGFRTGWRLPGRWTLPVVQGLLGYVVFVAGWRLGGVLSATWAVAGWAIGTTAVSLLVFRLRPDAVDERVVRSRSYRAEMLEWLVTGRGPESQPLRTVRRHLYELAAYVVAAAVTANLLSLVMGAVLLNYMNAWVAALLGAARRPLVVSVLAWNSWSVVRVAAYVVLGCACASPLAAVAGYPADADQVRLLARLGVIGVVADLVLKLALSRPCGRALAGAVDVDRVGAATSG